MRAEEKNPKRAEGLARLATFGFRDFSSRSKWMEKINDITYEVHSGEQITIRVTPTNFGDSLPSVEASLDGKRLPNSGTDDAPIFQVPVSKPAGRTHRVMMEFTFLPGSPDVACYNVSISGQNDVGCPCGFDICKADEDKEVTIAFDVVG